MFRAGFGIWLYKILIDACNISLPEHEVLKVSYCGQSISVVHRQ